ncbi:hypothetical protein ABPG75_007228 [Micractinium tetrahymenae]
MSICHAPHRAVEAPSRPPAGWPSHKPTAFALQPQEAPQMEECLLVEQLCCELLRSGSLDSECADTAAEAAAACQETSLPPPADEDSCAIAAAAAATAALLQGRGSAAATGPALSRLFPSACSLEVCLPAAAGGGRAIVPLASASGGAAVRCSARAQLLPVVFAAARCTLAAPAALPPAERRLLAAFAAELGRALGQSLTEQREDALDQASEAMRHGSVKVLPSPAALLVGSWSPAAGASGLLWA